jgi:16S rRNA processing protein RimM
MVEDQFKAYLKKDSFIFFDLSGSKVPYLVTSIDDGVHFVITLEDVPNKRESDLLSGLDVWIPLENVKPRHQRSPRNIRNKWDEYKIEDQRTNTVYEIVRVEEFPQQLMAIVIVNDKEIMIPLNDQLISSIDQESKMIRMEIPEGLLDL